nr:YhgE/Pip domain-containing protein [Ectobacillus ponti]
MLKTIRGEFSAIFQNRMRAIALIAIMFIPVLYTGTYLYAFKDPYSQLDQLPVAVVNLDKGAEHDGKQLTVGKDFVDKLKDKDNFQWHIVSDEQAKQGLKGQKYYMVIRIPENFSANAATLTEEHPKHLELEYMPNKAYNFLAAQISSSAVEKIKEEVAASITETYAEEMFDGVQSANEGFAKAHDGARELYDGLKDLASGSLTFTEKMGEASTGAGKLQEGMQSFQEKSNEFNAGMHQVESGTASFAEQTPQVQQGISSLAGGLQQLQKDGYAPLYQGAQSVQTGLQRASGSAAELAAGAKRLQDEGLAQLKEGTGRLYAGASDLADGSTDLAAGIVSAKGGADQTAAGAAGVDAGLEQLQAQIDQLPEPYKSQLQPAVEQLKAGSGSVQSGAKQVADGLGALVPGADKLKQGASDLRSGAAAAQTGVTAFGKSLDQVVQGQQQLSAGLGQLAQGQDTWLKGYESFGQSLDRASTGAGTLVQKTVPYFAAVPQLQSGMAQLADGSDKLTTGARTIQSKMGELTSGLQQLENGSKDIQEGAGKASDGSKELTSGLQDGVEKTGSTKGSKETYEMFAKPVDVKTEDFGHVENYGTGVSPYFISLGLYVGALLLSVVYPLREANGLPKSGFHWFLSKLSVVLLVGTIQSLVIDWVVMKGLHIEVQSTWRFMALAWITSVAFLTLIQFLVTTLGDAGRLVAIIILVLQLTTSGGTYPLEMVAPALQKAANYIPMTYSVNAFKAAIASGDFSYMWSNARVLGLWALACAAGTALCFTLLYRSYFRKLQQTAK